MRQFFNKFRKHVLIKRDNVLRIMLLRELPEFSWYRPVHVIAVGSRAKLTKIARL